LADPTYLEKLEIRDEYEEQRDRADAEISELNEVLSEIDQRRKMAKKILEAEKNATERETEILQLQGELTYLRKLVRFQDAGKGRSLRTALNVSLFLNFWLKLKILDKIEIL